MLLKLGTTGLLGNGKKPLKILAISLKTICERVYISHPPAYSFRGTWRRLLLLTTVIHSLMHLWKWFHFFQGIFHKLPSSCFYIVTSSMLEYEYLATETFRMLKRLQCPFDFWFSIEWYNTEQIMMKRWSYLVHDIIITLWGKKNVWQVNLSEPTKFDVFGTRFLSVV